MTNQSSVHQKLFFRFIRFLLPYLLMLCSLYFARHSAPYYDSLMEQSNQSNQYETVTR